MKKIISAITLSSLILQSTFVVAEENKLSKNTSRAEFVYALWQMDEEPSLEYSMPFTDVSNDDETSKAISWAYSEKIVNGTEADKFSPTNAITREDIATIIKRYADYKGTYTDFGADVSKYTDFNEGVSEYAKDSVIYCVAEGLYNGKSETELAPKDNITDEETAIVINRIKEKGIVNKTDSVSIIYTNDVHCAISGSTTFATVSAYRNKMDKLSSGTVLVDGGDAVQGDMCGTLSQGEFVIDIMNKVGYDYSAIGNHEFSYGDRKLHELLDKSNTQYLCCNIKYTGNNVSVIEKSIPYEVKTVGNIKIGFVGVSTPYTIASSTPSFFMENGEFVYDFSSVDTAVFYDTIQKNIDECKNEGAEVVVLLTHCGRTDEFIPFRSIDIINNTNNVDAVIDAHDHNIIESIIVENKDEEEVLLTSTGTKFESFGELTISPNKEISAKLIKDFKGYDKEVKALENEIKADCDSKLGEVIGYSDKTYTQLDEEGFRMIRTRGLPLGNFCADAYRNALDADIGLVNGGGIRESLYAGEIKKGNIQSIVPFNNGAVTKMVKGQNIVDALELSACKVDKEYKKEGRTFGEFGGFLQVSGLKFTIDTSIESGIKLDDNGMLIGMEGERRVKDILVLNEDGTYSPIDLDKEYKVASTDYVLVKNGDGQKAFDDCGEATLTGMLEYDVLVEYLTKYLDGNMSNFHGEEERITIK